MTREEKAQFCIDNPRHSPAFQFYSDNWWGSRHVAAMTVEQRGIHASLIFSAWLEQNCGIPENEVCLSARIPENLKESTSKVLEWCWFLFQRFWFCERLLNERIKQINLSNIRIRTGSEGGRPVKSKINKQKPISNQLDSKQKPNDNQMITKSEDEDEDENEDRNRDDNVIEKRSEIFKNELKLNLQYQPQTLADFYDYWSEPNKSKTKMRFELQPTWDLPRRLKTWASREGMNKNKPKYGYQPSTKEESLAQMERIHLT
jgi:hypothetical protein